MKKKKITGQQIKFIINMVSLAIFAYSYLYIYANFESKADTAYKQVDLVNKEIKISKDKAAKKDAVLKSTEDLKSQIQKILDSYPVDITKVDNLLFVEQMEKDLNIKFNTVNPTDSSTIFISILPIRNADGTEIEQVPSTDADQAGAAPTKAASQKDNASSGSRNQSQQLEDIEAETSGGSSGTAAAQKTTDPAKITTMTGLESTITMNFQTTYEGFKQLVDYINHYPDKTIIDSVSVSRDSTTNDLTGTLVLKRYALAGTGKVYETPVIDDISIGTDNIFGTDSTGEISPAPTETPLEGSTLTEP